MKGRRAGSIGLAGDDLNDYVRREDALDVHFTLINFRDSGVVLDWASIFPLALHLPGGEGAKWIEDNVDAPGERWSGVTVAVVVPVADKVI